MKHRNPLWTLLTTAALLVPLTLSTGALAQTTRPADRVTDDQIGRAVYVGHELLLDYRPEPALVVPRTQVEKPKFPAVDIHCHWSIKQSPQSLLAAMDKLGLRTAVNLSGGNGEELDAMLAACSIAPDRLKVLANLDMDRINDPDFGPAMAQMLRDAHGKGVTGLKLFKDFGLTLRNPDGSVIPVDDPRFDPIWDVCAELKMPVLIHSADPKAFFDPIDRFNERWMQLQRHPDWQFPADKYPSWQQVLGQHIALIRKHPETVFISAHLANSGEDLSQLSRWLDECPNLYVDISGRVGEIGRQPYSARKFLIAHQDRVLYGTDRYPGRLDQPRHAINFRFLETDDEYFDYYDHPYPTEGDWRIYGVFLPDEVLGKIYHANADRVLAGLPPLK